MTGFVISLLGMIPVGYCAYTDLKTCKIKNIVTLPESIFPYIMLISIIYKKHLSKLLKKTQI